MEPLAVPPDVRQLLQHTKHEVGFVGLWAWAFSRSQLVVWQPEAAAATVYAHRLPYASSSVRHHVCVLPDALTPGACMAVVWSTCVPPASPTWRLPLSANCNSVCVV